MRQLDPKKEVEAAELRVAGGFSTRQRETAELTGTDFYRNIKQRDREEKLLKEVIKHAEPSGKVTNNNKDTKSDNNGGETEEEAEE